MRKGRGVHYVAVGVGSYGEAVRSAHSLKEHMPEMHITIHTDQEDVSSVFDVVERVPSRVPGYEHLPLYPDNAFYGKVKYGSQILYEFNLFLDSDTFICARLDGLFELLEGGRFDIALAHDVSRIQGSQLRLPESFPVFNTGVILFRNCPSVIMAMLVWWKDFVEHADIWGDQIILQRTLYNSNTRLYVLPPEYNFRWMYPGFAGGQVKILHGHGEIERIPDRINVMVVQPRIWLDRKIVGFYVSDIFTRQDFQNRINDLAFADHRIDMERKRKR